MTDSSRHGARRTSGRAIWTLRAVMLCLVVPAVFTLRAQAQEARSLPDKETLFVATRDNLARAEREQRFFAYKERRTDIRTNPFGRLGSGPIRRRPPVFSSTGL